MRPAASQRQHDSDTATLADVLWALPHDVLEASLWAQLSAEEVHAFKLACQDANAACCATRPRVKLCAATLDPQELQQQLAALQRRSGLKEVCVDVSGLPGRHRDTALQRVVPLLHAGRDAASFAQRVEACSVRFDLHQPDPDFHDKWPLGQERLPARYCDVVDGWYEDRDEWYEEHEGAFWENIVRYSIAKDDGMITPLLMTSELPSVLVRAFPGLTSLALTAPLAGAWALDPLTWGLPRLRTLSLALSGTNPMARPWAELGTVQDVMAEVLPRMPALYSLSLSCKVHDAADIIDLAPLGALTQLSQLRLAVTPSDGWTFGTSSPWTPVCNGGVLPPALVCLDMPMARLDAAFTAALGSCSSLRSLCVESLVVPAPCQQPGQQRQQQHLQQLTALTITGLLPAHHGADLQHWQAPPGVHVDVTLAALALGGIGVEGEYVGNAFLEVTAADLRHMLQRLASAASVGLTLCFGPWQGIGCGSKTLKETQDFYLHVVEDHFVSNEFLASLRRREGDALDLMSGRTPDELVCAAAEELGGKLRSLRTVGYGCTLLAAMFTGATAACLAAHCPSLERLDLQCGRVTRAFVQRLLAAPLPRLAEVRLDAAGRISAGRWPAAFSSALQARLQAAAAPLPLLPPPGGGLGACAGSSSGGCSASWHQQQLLVTTSLLTADEAAALQEEARRSGWPGLRVVAGPRAGEVPQHQQYRFQQPNQVRDAEESE